MNRFVSAEPVGRLQPNWMGAEPVAKSLANLMVRPGLAQWLTLGAAQRLEDARPAPERVRLHECHARLAARCARRGVALHAANPAYSSMIGEKKYARGLNLTRHHAAALVLARRAMGYGERLVCTRRGALVSAAQHEPRHVWRQWRDARPRRPRERSTRTAASASGGSRTGAARRSWACAVASPPAVSTRSGRTSAGVAVPPADPV
jgi:hypothetical protein